MATPPALEVQPQAPAPPVAPPPAQESALADWSIPWELDWAEPEPPPAAVAFNILPTPEPTAAGLSWSRREPGVLLTWDINSVRVSTNGGIAWTQAWSGPQPEGGYTSPGRAATWGGSSVLLPTGLGGALLSNDGGRSFRPLARPNLPGTDGADALRPSRRTLLADGALALLAEQGRRTLVHMSRSGGVNWQLAASGDTSIDELVPLAKGFGLLRKSGLTVEYAATVDSGWSRIGRNSLYAVTSFHYGGAMHLLTTDGSLARLSARDGLRTVRLPGMPMREPVGFAIDPRDARHLLVADASLGLLRSVDGGLTWQGSTWRFSSRITALDLVGRRRPRLAVLTSRSLVLIDLDNRLGDHFRPLADPGEALRRIDLPGLASTVPVGVGVRQPEARSLVAWSYGQAWMSQDGGGSWTRSEFQAPTSPDLAAMPTWDGKGTRMILPVAADLALIGDVAGGQFRPLAPPWGRTADAAYAIPPAIRSEGLIVAGWAPQGARTGDGKTLRVCTTRDLGRTWTEERKVAMRQWRVVDPDMPLLASSDNDGLVISPDYGRNERVLEAAGRYSAGPIWCLVGRQLWWIDRGWSRVTAFDLDAQRQRSQAIRAPGASEEYSYYRSMTVDPRDPQRMWVGDYAFGLIFSDDGGRTWRMMDGSVGSAISSQIRFVGEPQPHLLLGGQGCLWRLDAGAAGAALFDRPCLVIP